MPARHVLVALLCLVLMSTAAAAPLYHGTVMPDDYRWLQDDTGQYRIDFAAGRPLGVTGQPDLPGQSLLLLVPADLPVVDVTIEPLSVRTEAVPGKIALAEALQGSEGGRVEQHHVAASATAFPERWGHFGGLHAWRGYRLLAVNVHPFRIVDDGAGQHLEVLERFAVEVVTDPSAAPAPLIERQRLVPGERDELERVLSAMVANPERVTSYARQDGLAVEKNGDPFLPAPLPQTTGSAVRYLIITTEELAGEFQRLADYRTAMGLPGLVVTTEWIQANYRAGADLQETIRFFLQDAYAKWGLDFVLMGGDTDVVPTRIIRSTFYPYGGHTDVPTDMYFAALDGTWSADGDGWYGEPFVSTENPGDSADLAPELAVGRAPVRDVLGAGQFIDKIIQYEGALPDDSWTNRALFAAEVLFPSDWQPGDTVTLDGAEYADRLINNYFIPCTDMEIVSLYENTSVYPADDILTRANFINELNTGDYSQVCQFGHGHFFNMSVGDANFTVADAAALTNPNYFVLFALNCASGAYDVSCLLERFVQNPHGGSIQSLGAAREAFPSNSFAYQEVTFDNLLCMGRPRTAVAFNQARLTYVGNTERNTVDRWTQLNAVLLGDPAIAVWNAQPVVPQITAPASLVVGEQQVSIQINVAGHPRAGVDVCVNKDGETYAQGVTGADGSVLLDILPTTGGELGVTASGLGLTVTQMTIPVAGSDTYLELTDVTLDDSSQNDNGRIEAGESVSLYPSFTDVGGAGATGLVVTASCDDDDISLLVDEVALPDCPPGGTTTAASPLVIRSELTVRDGESFDLRLEVTDGAESWVSIHRVDVCAPDFRLVSVTLDDSVYGDQDGVPEDGEQLVVRPVLKNYGAGRVDQMIFQLLDPAPGVTIHSSSAVLVDLDSFDEAGPELGVLSLTLDDVDMAAPCRLYMQDNYGRTAQVDLEFAAVVPPSNLTTDATVAPDAIALRWDPVPEQPVVGYNVYRAESAGGPFVKANPDLIEGLAYFEDRGLDQLTFYWYQVTAVDEHYTESPVSATAAQTTMPAELENFPLPFAVQTSGHSAVGDVDGDGHLEIVLASDEVYVWNHDGSELLDGDGNPQTTGPLSGVEGQFGPAGVALAELDGEPGLEIVVAERSGQPRIMIYKADGTQLDGWPRDLQNAWNWSTPSVGDVDGDGDLEIMALDTGGRLFVWHHDGTELLDGDSNPATDGVFIDRPDSWPLSSPAMEDLDGDGACEMIWGTLNWSGDNGLLAYRYDGTQVPGFPVETGSARVLCSPAVADINRDGTREIIFFSTANRLYVVDNQGQDFPGFPIQYTETSSDGSPGPSPAVGNFDTDTDFEILWPINAGTHRMDLLVVDTDVAGGTSGDIMHGWPVSLPANSEGSPVVGDLDGDGMADIVQPIGSDETETPDLITAYNARGQGLAGFPIALGGHCRATPVICDLDEDGDVDLVYGSWDLELHVWDLPGAYDPTVVPWPMFQATPQRDGQAIQVSIIGVEEEEVPAAFTVLPPRPNPFNPITTVRLYVAPGDTRLDVAVFDVRGRMVRQLHRGDSQPGWREFTWDGRDDAGRGQASGVYFVRARQATEATTFKMTLVK